MTRRVAHWSLLLSLFAVMFATPALARHGDRGGKGLMNPRMIERLATELQLDAATTEQIRAIALEAKMKSIDLRADLEKARLKMKALMAQDPPPRAQVMAQIDQIAALRAQRHKLKTGALLDVRAKLTSEQWAKVKTLKRTHRGKRGRRDGRRGWRPGRERGHDGPPVDLDEGPED